MRSPTCCSKLFHPLLKSSSLIVDFFRQSLLSKAALLGSIELSSLFVRKVSESVNHTTLPVQNELYELECSILDPEVRYRLQANYPPPAVLYTLDPNGFSGSSILAMRIIIIELSMIRSEFPDSYSARPEWLALAGELASIHNQLTERGQDDYGSRK